jgi:hypothetical protein
MTRGLGRLDFRVSATDQSTYQEIRRELLAKTRLFVTSTFEQLSPTKMANPTLGSEAKKFVRELLPQLQQLRKSETFLKMIF